MSTGLRMRTLPGVSGLHRVWAGTKLIAVVVIVIVSVAAPGWRTVVLVFALAVAGAVAARVPRSALPRPPIWLGVFLVAAAAVASVGGGLVPYAESIGLAAGLLALSVLVVWTTALSDVAPTVSALGAPLARLGVPVDEWAVTVALGVRSLPLLTDEFRVLLAARTLRRGSPAVGGLRRDGVANGVVARGGPFRGGLVRGGLARTARRKAAELVDLTTALLSVSLRRAGDAGVAIELRGGVPRPVGRVPRLGTPDLVVAASTVAFAVVALALPGG